MRLAFAQARKSSIFQNFYCIVFRVWRIYCEMMSCLLRATCTVKMSSSCQFSLVFPCTTPTHFISFPSFYFHSLFSFLFFPWHFIRFGVLLNFPRVLSIFLVSFLCFFLCFCKFFMLLPLLLFFLSRLFSC